MSPFQICALPAGVQAKLGQGLQGRQQDFRGLNGQLQERNQEDMQENEKERQSETNYIVPESPLPALIPNSPRLPPQILNPLDRYQEKEKEKEKGKRK